MSVPAATLRKLAALKLSAHQMAGVLDILADGIEAEEARKEAQRERTRRAREKQRGNVTDPRQSRDRNSDDTRGRDARVEDKTSNLDIEPQKKDRGAKRAMRLPSDWTLPVEWRQDALDAGLPENQIDLQAATMRDWSRSAPKGAKTDWRAAWRNWCRRSAEDAKARAGPVKVPQMADVFQLIARQDDGRQAQDDSSSTGPAIPHLSAVGSGR